MKIMQDASKYGIICASRVAIFSFFSGWRPPVTRSSCAVLAVLAGAALSACSNQRQQSMPTYPVDYRDRHPINLVDSNRSLDIFITSAHGLDARQRRDLAGFAGEYRRGAKSDITIKVPAGTKTIVSTDVKNTLKGVRQSLLSSGVPGRMIRIQSYYDQVDGSPPIRLSFVRLEAKVGSKCGQWPRDLAGGDSLSSWENGPYWNLGCSYQETLAAQVADPIDLVRGRPEGRIDTVKRMTGVEKLRKGDDPSTKYNKNPSAISDIGK